MIQGITGGADASSLEIGDILITWDRRTRLGCDLVDGHDAPIGETDERYEIDIHSGDAVVRTVTGLTQPYWIYTAAYQVADFGAALHTLPAVKIYQLSDIVGRGHPGE